MFRSSLRLLCDSLSSVCLALLLATLLSATMIPAGEAAAAPGPDRADGGAADPDATDRQIAELIEELGSTRFVDRRRAERELLRLGYDAFDALQEAESHDDLEIARRARYLVQQIRVAWVQRGDSDEVRLHLSGYDQLDDGDRLVRCRRLAALSDDAGLAALCRVVRFEQSPILAKQAALILLQPPQGNDELWKARREPMDEALGRSRRPAAAWLRARLQAIDDPQAALDSFKKLAAAEQRELTSSRDDSHPRIVVALLRQQVDLLKQLERHEEAVAAMIAMMDLEDGDPDSLARMVDWLVEQEAWSQIDQLAERFNAQFEKNPLLLYTLAQARVEQGKEELANEVAQRALKLFPHEPRQHMVVAYQLQQRGLLRWSEMEFRRVIEMGPAESDTAVRSEFLLSEMLHDQLREEEAADVVKGTVEAMEDNLKVRKVVMEIGRDPAAVRSRMEFFRSEHDRLQKDFDEQRKHLDAAIKHDPSDADVLIAMHRLEGADEAYRATTRKLIRTAAAKFAKEIEEDPEESLGYNQYAWLIGNTEGDRERAIRYAHRAVQLSPESAGHLDTLAHCYAGKGDYENAVKYQQQAVNLDPHTQYIARKLAEFQAGRDAAGSAGRDAAEAVEGATPVP